MAEEGEFMEKVSTRMLLNAARQMGDGMPKGTAMKFCIEQSFSGEGGDSSERAALRQLMQKQGLV